MADKKKPTPKLDELEKGPWPSFVKEIKLSAETNVATQDLLGILERSYNDKIGHWKHGGIVGVKGYGGGIIGRYNDIPEEFPEIAEFHTIRVNQPSGWFYTSDALRKLCDIWEKHGSGLTNMHGSTGDIIFLGTKTDGAGAHLLGAHRGRVRSRRLRLGHAHAQRLLRHGPLRVGVLRHHGPRLRPHHDLPGRTAPPGLPVQVQVQDGGLPERLRRLHRPRRHVDHRDLARQHPDRQGRRSRPTRAAASATSPGTSSGSAPPSAWAGTGRTSPSTTATACAACTAST